VRHTVSALLLYMLCAGGAALATEPPLDLTREPLAATLAAEYALHAGALDDAVDWYLHAARAAPESAELAERAAWIALLGPDDGKAAEALALWSARVPRSQAIRAAEVELAIRAGKTRKARAELIALLGDVEPPGWPYAMFALGRSGHSPARLAKLIGQLLDADAIPDILPAWVQLGSLAFGMNHDHLAERISEQIVQRFPDEPRVALLRARQLREAGRVEDARVLLDGADVAALKAQGLGIALAAEFEALDDFARAEQLLAEEPQIPQLVALRASLLARSDDRDGLAALYAEWRTQASLPDPAQRLLLGQMAEYLERFDEALDWYEAVPVGEERFRSRLRMAVVLQQLGRRAQAHALARQLQEDAALEQEMRINAYLLEANLYQQDEDVHGESDVFARGLAAWPDALELLYARSMMWERRDEVARAEADLRQMLIIEPENTSALNALGYILADRTRRYAEALALIERARLAEPDNPAIIDSYGWVLYRLGRGKDALVHLRRAWTLSKDAEIAAHMGEVLWALGQRDEARWFFEEARKLEPEHRALQRALQETGA